MDNTWRDRVWSDIAQPWDLIVVGGGITGAGIFREASRAGLRTLLVEAHDFAAGTSSRSSKLVHGGFRYLRSGQFRLTYESVRERERLLRQGRGLVKPLGFLLACYAHDRIPPWLFGIGLTCYDLMALKWSHKYYNSADLSGLCPPLNDRGLLGGFRYLDALADDARLVLRLLFESLHQDAHALNYARVESLLKDRTGQVSGVLLRDTSAGENGPVFELRAPIVVNATGAWADTLRGQVGAKSRLRPLRGSHLVFPHQKLPLTRAVSFLHPLDGRPVFAIPWEGVTIFGTTDIDEGRDLPIDPSISPAEGEYLMGAIQHAFPSLGLRFEDIQATFSGFRAVVGTGKSNPSKESREHVVWEEKGLLTVTGGKLTTFRLMAHDALKFIRKQLSGMPRFTRQDRLLAPVSPDILEDLPLDAPARTRLLGRYGANAPHLACAAGPDEFEPIETSPALWAELRWASQAEGVVHLDDLLLRRVRLGLFLPQGGIRMMDRIRRIAQPELGWDDQRWAREYEAYCDLWKSCYQIRWV